MKPTLLFLSLLFIQFCSTAQYYAYVEFESVRILKRPSADSDMFYELAKYSNVEVLDTIEGGWLKIKHERRTGFVKQEYLKEGKVSIRTITGGRIGAICKDGTSSSATGRGACSRHGGVRSWRYATQQKIEVIPNN